jgi:hypothetical protein
VEDLGGIQNFQRRGHDFDCTGGEFCVLCASEARSDFASDANDILTAQFVGFFRGIGMFLGTENNLRDALAVRGGR